MMQDDGSLQAAAASLAFKMARAVAFCQTLEVGGLDCQAAGTIFAF